MRIGVDVGGTNTDAVLMDGDLVVASHKSPTSQNIKDGVVDAITNIMSGGGANPSDINAVMIGTTQFTNAFVERRGLLPVGVVRLALPATSALPPMIDWPEDIAAALGEHVYLVKGGYEFDARNISPLDENAIAEAARDMRAKGIRAVAICGVFSPVKADMEERAAQIILSEQPDASITLSSRIGKIGLLERENAAIMNASLADLSVQVVNSFKEALFKLKISAPFYISQNDGTLMSSEHVEKYPVLTFSSGPTNSMRGAAYLSKLKDAIVADIGGTTTDIGVLVKGFPRESSVTVDIGGVRTNFRMPDIISLGLGGGSLVAEGEEIEIGPKSVGYRLSEKSLVFGGDTLTTTDIAVAAGYATGIGQSERLAGLSAELIKSSVEKIHSIIANGVDRIKTSAEPVPLILVGGGSVLINQDIEGCSEVIVPEHAGVANAIGASIAQVGAEVEKVYSYEVIGRDNAIADIRQAAIAAVVEAGAEEASVELIDFEEIPLSYVPGNAVRLRAKTAGDLKHAN